MGCDMTQTGRFPGTLAIRLIPSAPVLPWSLLRDVDCMITSSLL
jgi:hypothetical protein